jgi:hypothetical protein
MFQWKTLKDANEEYSTVNFLRCTYGKMHLSFLSFYFNFFIFGFQNILLWKKFDQNQRKKDLKGDATQIKHNEQQTMAHNG